MVTKKATTKKKTPTLKTLSFKNLKDWKKWLKDNEKSSPGIWIKFRKKGTAASVLTYPEARDEAICYGWIDGQIKSIDENYYLRRFTPRKPKSIWSKFNRELVEKLIKEKRMTTSGMKEVKEAKADGRWAKAYDSAKTAEPPEDFLKLIAKSKRAQNFWDGLTKSKKYPMIWKLQVLKTEKKRNEWMDKFVKLLSRGEIFEVFPSKKKPTSTKTSQSSN